MGLLFQYPCDEDSSMDHTRQTSLGSMREFSKDEEALIARMFKLVGNRWHLIAGRIPGRTAEEIEQYYASNFLSREH